MAKFASIGQLSAAVLALLALGACELSPRATSSAPDASVTAATETVVTDSASARARIAELRQRFVVKYVATPTIGAPLRGQESTPAPVLGFGLATGFESSASSGMHAVFALEAKRGVTRTARTALPLRANGAARLRMPPRISA